MSAEELAQLKQGIRSTADARDKERLQVVLWSTSGQHPLAELARLAGRARSTLQIWLEDYPAGGLTKLLERKTPPARPAWWARDRNSPWCWGSDLFPGVRRAATARVLWEVDLLSRKRGDAR